MIRKGVSRSPTLDAEFHEQTGLTLIPLLNVAIAIYTTLALAHWFLLPPNASRLMAPVAGSTAISLVLMRASSSNLKNGNISPQFHIVYNKIMHASPDKAPSMVQS